MGIGLSISRTIIENQGGELAGAYKVMPLGICISHCRMQQGIGSQVMIMLKDQPSPILQPSNIAVVVRPILKLMR